MDHESRQKVQWLMRYKDSRQAQSRLEKELEQLRSDAVRVTPLLTGVPGGPSDGQSLPRAVERIVAAQEALEKQITECLEIRREVEAVIDQVDDPRDHEILRRRYILGQRWEQIAVEMPLDYSNVHKRHRRALEKIAIVCHS